ncbi:BTB/POZ protein [Rhizophagus irregularis DAOM 181602=DAOM 197198]|nr:BTB/POZ protein [Rhizophagus irregularis DAOM 181602=DAOM 197198]
MDCDKFLPKLSQNFLEILNDNEYFDITIEVAILTYIYGANWMEQNFNLMNQTSFKYDSFLELQEFCRGLITKHPEKIFSSPDFTSLPENTLITLIQQDNIQISRVQIWEHLIRWGIAQNPELPSDLSKYSDDDFNTLKVTMQRCISFINFHNFTRQEFSKKVFPYKKILDRDLFDGVIQYFLENDNSPSSNEILGGYNPIEWDSRFSSYKCYGTTRNSFIFSFMNKENIGNYVLSRVRNEYQAVNYLPHHGPSFGPDDLILYGGREHSFNTCNSHCKQLSYEKQIRETEEKFSVKEYEVFQIST